MDRIYLAVGSTRTTANNTNNQHQHQHQHQPDHVVPIDDRVVRLCDIKSGSVSHELIGHGTGRDGSGGVGVIQWSPTREFELASGGNDGCVKVFDVRKSGSGACLFTLDRQKRTVRFGQRIEGESGSRTNRLPAKRRRNNPGGLAVVLTFVTVV